jgi:sorting nexin-4
MLRLSDALLDCSLDYEAVPIDASSPTKSKLPASSPGPLRRHSATPPPTSHLGTDHSSFEDVFDDPDYDSIGDRDELEEEYLRTTGNPLAIRREAMAEDFSEGRLETRVDTPLKELAGTQNQYVSYLVTTKVGLTLRRSPCDT